MKKIKVYVTYPKSQIAEPVICEAYDKFKVPFNIRSASVNDHMGIMALEFQSESQQKLDDLVAFLKDKGLSVDPIELGVVAG